MSDLSLGRCRRTHNPEQERKGHETVRFWMSRNLRTWPKVTSFLLCAVRTLRKTTTMYNNCTSFRTFQPQNSIKFKIKDFPLTWNNLALFSSSHHGLVNLLFVEHCISQRRPSNHIPFPMFSDNVTSALLPLSDGFCVLPLGPGWTLVAASPTKSGKSEALWFPPPGHLNKLHGLSLCSLAWGPPPGNPAATATGTHRPRGKARRVSVFQPMPSWGPRQGRKVGK